MAGNATGGIYAHCAHSYMTEIEMQLVDLATSYMRQHCLREREVFTRFVSTIDDMGHLTTYCDERTYLATPLSDRNTQLCK